MSHRSTHTNHFKIYSLRLKLKRRLATISERIFAAPDAAARRHGWQVTITNHGLGRSYRDPRFDRLRACSACKGQGRYPGDTVCSVCHGTGRIVLNPVAPPQRGRGQP